MKDHKMLVYQLLIIALIIALGLTVWQARYARPAEEPAPVAETDADGWRRIEPSEIQENPIELFDGYKGILAMGKEGETNAMTIGWGTIGMLWREPVLNVYVSSSRYSHQLMERNDEFTVSFFNRSFMDDIMYLGRHSGRDGDKISHTNMHLRYTDRGNPAFDEAFMTIECSKQYGAPFDSARIGDIPQHLYGSLPIGIHSVYVGKILNIYVKDANR